MMDKVTCPSCGSEKMESVTTTKEEFLPWGTRLTYEKITDTCLSCGESGEFTDITDKNYLDALEIAKKSSAETIIEYLSSLGISMAYFERALSLPQRTLTRWKYQGCSASGMTLLRMIRTFPWLLKVADEKYDVDFARGELLGQIKNLIDQTYKGTFYVNVNVGVDVVFKSNKTQPFRLESDKVSITDNEFKGDIKSNYLLKNLLPKAGV